MLHYTEVWLDAFCIWLLVGLILPLVLVFVLDFNLILKFHTWMLSKELLNMLVELVIMDYFIVKSLICLLLIFLILIGLVILMIEKAPPVGVFM